MQIVLKYAKPGEDGVETIRTQTIDQKNRSNAHFKWHEAVATAVFHSQKGERIVAIIEGGYD